MHVEYIACTETTGELVHVYLHTFLLSAVFLGSGSILRSAHTHTSSNVSLY